MRWKFFACLVGALSLGAQPVLAQMDYGPFLTATYVMPWPKDNVANKGVAVRFELPIEGEAPAEGPIGGGNYANRSVKTPEVDAVYQTQRVDFGGYRLNVPNGKYKIVLKFCEGRDAKSKGAFDIILQGKKVADKVDLIAKAGRDTPYDLPFEGVEVSGGQLAIEFGGQRSGVSLAAVEIEAADFKRKLKCGGPAVKDYVADWPAGYSMPKNPALAGVVFDTELLRFASAWTGDFVAYKGVVFDGSHGPNPGPGGIQRLATRATPGWAFDGDLRDPRSIPHGPLPREWAHYHGLYRHEKGIVFAYSVGDCQILELPGAAVVDKVRVFTRTLNLKPNARPLVLVVADLDGAKGRLDGGVGYLETPERTIAARVAGGPEGSALSVTEDGRLLLKIPASTKDSQLKLSLWGGATKEAAEAVPTLAKTGPATDLSELTKGGKAQWEKTVTLQGTRAPDAQAYVLDDIPVPYQNPYNSIMRFGGLDFFSDGRAAICTWSGDVWVVSGIDDNLEKVTWKRFAAGMFQTLGLKIVDDVVYVLGRDGISRLRDLNGDGEADFYEAFNHDVMVTQNFHEFAFELQTDREGNFYFAKAGPVRPGGSGWDKITPHHGCLFKVYKDGSKLEVVARGFRAPNGIGIGPNGELTVADNEGTWTPMCPLNWVKPGGFYGVPDFSDRNPKPTVRDNPLCWFPKEIDNSNGGQVWITSDKFGPLSGQLLHSSYGTCQLFAVLKEEVHGEMQGGVVPLPIKFETGICRARFLPNQNALYLVGLRGWQTRASKDAGFYRVRYTGKPANLPIEMHVLPTEVRITFTDKLDKKSVEDTGSYGVERWNYRWTSSYGSPHVKVSDPKKQGHDEVEVESAKLLDDGKTVVLKLTDLQPVMQMKIDYKLKAADGTPVKSTIHQTINVVGDLKAELHPGEFKIVPVK